MGPFGYHMVPFGSHMGQVGSHLVVSGILLRPIESIMGTFRIHFVLFGRHLRPYGSHLGPFSSHLGPLRIHLVRISYYITIVSCNKIDIHALLHFTLFVYIQMTTTLLHHSVLSPLSGSNLSIDETSEIPAKIHKTALVSESQVEEPQHLFLLS